MRLVPAGENTALVGAWMHEKTGVDFKEGTYQALMVLDDTDTFCAAVIVNNFRGFDCELSCAAEVQSAWRPHVCAAIAHYLFLQLGCTRVTAKVRKTNKRARSTLEGMGFQLEGRLRKGYDGVKDALIYGLLAGECAYLNE